MSYGGSDRGELSCDSGALFRIARSVEAGHEFLESVPETRIQTSRSDVCVGTGTVPRVRSCFSSGTTTEAIMKKISAGQIALLVALGAMLILTGVWGVSVWESSSGVEMGKHGWIALGLGAFFSLLIGCGLMALMFFSSRSGHDDVADPFRRRDGEDS